MSDTEPDVPPPAPGGLALEPPHRNGADHVAVPAAVAQPHPWRRRIAVLLLAAVVIAWLAAIAYSVFKPTPEPLDRASTRAVQAACRVALTKLRGLDTAPRDAAGLGQHIRDEDEAFTAMIAALGAIDPPNESGRVALRRWSGDWEELVAARERYATDLVTTGRAQWREPVVKKGDLKPVTTRMNEYANIHGLTLCTTDSLQAEIVEGPRHYTEE